MTTFLKFRCTKKLREKISFCTCQIYRKVEWHRGRVIIKGYAFVETIYGKCSHLIKEHKFSFPKSDSNERLKTIDQPWYTTEILCKKIQKHCQGKNAQFNSVEECTKFTKSYDDCASKVGGTFSS